MQVKVTIRRGLGLGEGHDCEGYMETLTQVGAAAGTQLSPIYYLPNPPSYHPGAVCFHRPSSIKLLWMSVSGVINL